MADQAKITDFFSNGKRGGAHLRKRKASPTRTELSGPLDHLFSKRKYQKPREEELSPSKTISLTTRGRILLSLSQSPTKSPQKSLASTTNADSPARRKLSLADALKSPTKCGPDEPAYARFKHLASRESENVLVLPSKYKALSETFRCLDTVVSILHNRKEACTFDKVKKGVQEMTRRTFDLQKLAQVNAVLPEAYKVEYDKQAKLSKDTARLEYTLVLKPVIETKMMSPAIILQRKRAFAKKLLELAMNHHQIFLESLDTPIKVDKKSVMRWHPSFRIEDLPDIEPALNTLPKIPSKNGSSQVESYLFGQNQRSEDSTEASSSSSMPSLPPVLSSPMKINSGALKGLSAGLLEKIRKKEAMNIAKEMTRSPEIEKKISMIKRLPEFIRIIHNYFIGEKKTTLSLDSVVNKVMDSYYTCTSGPEVLNMVKLLAELLSNWLFILEVKKGSFVKIDKTMTTEELVKRLDSTVERLKSKVAAKAN